MLHDVQAEFKTMGYVFFNYLVITHFCLTLMRATETSWLSLYYGYLDESGEDSQKQKGLQAVDYVAWAFHQKYEHEDDALHEIIAPRIVLEQVTNRERG